MKTFNDSDEVSFFCSRVSNLTGLTGQVFETRIHNEPELRTASKK